MPFISTPVYSRLLLVFLICVGLGACSASRNRPPAFNIVTPKSSDRVTLAVAGAEATLDIFSETGIGGAEVRLSAGEFPQKMLLRLHLQGLEELRVFYADQVLLASVSSSGKREVRQSRGVARGDSLEWQPLEPGSRYWMEIRIAGDNPQIPLTGGYFEVQLPRFFREERISQFSLRWIDFYRE